MQSDFVTRGLLGFVILLTVLLLFQRLVLPVWNQASPVESRYDLLRVRSGDGPVLVRADARTGAVWKRLVEGDAPWDRLSDEVVVVPPDPTDRPWEKKRQPKLAQLGEAPKGLLELAREMGVLTPDDPEPDFTELLKVIRAGNQPVLRDVALNTIASFPPEQASPALLTLLEGPPPDVVVKVIRSLKKLGHPSAIEPLRELSKSHPNSRVKNAAASAVTALESADPPPST